MNQKELNYFYDKYCKEILNYKAIRILNSKESPLFISKMIDEFAIKKSKTSNHTLKVNSTFSFGDFEDFFKYDKKVEFKNDRTKIYDLFIINYTWDVKKYRKLSKIGKVIYVNDNYLDGYEPEYFIDMSKWTSERYIKEIRNKKLNRIIL